MRPIFFVVLVLAAGSLIAGACGDSADDGNGAGGPSDGDDRILETAPIDEVELIVRETAPPQYAVRIVSGLPNGCAEFHAAQLAAALNNEIVIVVQNSVPADPNVVCTAVYGTHEETIELTAIAIGHTEYTVRVNDKELKFTPE